MTPSYAIVIEKRADRELRSLPVAAQQRIAVAIAALGADPRPPGCKKLAGKHGAWRIRVGDYRVVYDIHDDVLRVIIIRVGHRRDVYR